MKAGLKRAFILNIIGLPALFVSYFFQYKMNKLYLENTLWMVFLTEEAYWVTVSLSLFACRKLRN